MFEMKTPEQAGVSSEDVMRFVNTLNQMGLATHGVLLMRGTSVFGEFYWKPFHRDYCHRMYSQTKSFVGVAVGLLLADGRLTLDDPVAAYFPDKAERELPENLRRLTIRNLLTMETCGRTGSWFECDDPDRVHWYMNDNSAHLPGGMRFEYDSPGSQVLCTLVERLSGLSFFDFLNQRLFSKMGAFQTASVLKTRNDDSFGDSAMLCTLRDIAAFARLLMNGGRWQGRQLIDEAYVRAATAPQVDNDEMGFDSWETRGYGYQIWCLRNQGFFFNGMGAQMTFCFPEKDLIFAVMSDNQGYPGAKSIIETAFQCCILDRMADAPLPENPEAYARCLALGEGLELARLAGPPHSAFAAELEGKSYACPENPTGITRFSFHFPSQDEGELHYTNAQGDKTLRFGLGKNVFDFFPQLGYSNDHAGLRTTDGFRYRCAASAAWREPRKLLIKVQIIDRYFGNMLAMFSFAGDTAVVRMHKSAEDFLQEYQGEFVARCL